MAEPLKNLLHPGLVDDMAATIRAADDCFDAALFCAVAKRNLDRLELMERAQQIRDALFQTLPQPFIAAAKVLADSLPTPGKPGLSGWALLPVNQFIAERGLGDFDVALDLLKRLTPHFTAEFGIRPFVHADQPRALATITGWVTHQNHHVRRLASEGTRPRLPWAMRLPRLIKDPEPLLPILEALLDDPEDYVRRSVANSLNDIAKDHPSLVADFVGRHLADASKDRRALLRHASRTLLKKGHVKALANFGFGDATGLACGALTLANRQILFGSALDFSTRIHNATDAAKQAMLDYAVHHRKADGSLAAKVFKWKALTLSPGATLDISKRHWFRPITARRYYGGMHRLVILVNGEEVEAADFDLILG